MTEESTNPTGYILKGISMGPMGLSWHECIETDQGVFLLAQLQIDLTKTQDLRKSYEVKLEILRENWNMEKNEITITEATWGIYLSMRKHATIKDELLYPEHPRNIYRVIQAQEE